MQKRNLLKCLLILGMTFVSCSLTDDGLNPIGLQANVDELTKNASSGSWRITNFIDSGRDDTANFEGYRFFFELDGILFAKSSTNDVIGDWSIEIDSLNNSSIGGDDCNGCTTSQLTDILTACPDWHIDKLERDDEDLEDTLSGFRFNFSTDGTIRAENGSNSYSGSWESNGDDNNISITITITGIAEIEETWNLHEIELENGESKIDFRNGGDNRLRFKNSCTLNNFENLPNDSSSIIFNIFFASPASFNELSKDWNVVSHAASKIDLIHTSDGNGGTDLLTLEKN